MATEHQVTTIVDLIHLYRKLPDDRAELMISELVAGVRAAGAYFNLLEAAGAEVSSYPQAMTWIDDDKGETTINTYLPDGEPFLSLKLTKEAKQ